MTEESATKPAVETTEISKAPQTQITITNGQRGLEIRTLDDLKTFCNMVINSGLAPKSFDSPAKVAIAIQRGSEVGLSPMQSLDSFYVTNGKVTMWGDSIPALIRASGKCEYLRERLEVSGDKMVAICEGKRSDTGEEAVRTFSIEDAKTARLWGKSGPWTDYPKRQLQMRARGFLARDLWADVLRGLSVKEEVDDYQDFSPRGPKTVQILEGE